MKNILAFTLLVLASIPAIAQKYWDNSSFSSSFDTKKNYTVLILPATSTDADFAAGDDLLNLAYTELTITLTGAPNIKVVSKQAATDAINTYRFGGGPISPSNYADLCKATGANLIVTCELSNDATVFKRKELTTVMALLQVLYADSGFGVVYTGKARMINPISKQAETEEAVRRAAQPFVDKLK